MRRFRLITIASIFVALALLGTRLGAQEQAWQSFTGRAVQAFNNGKPAEAEKLLEQAVQATDQLGAKNTGRAAAMDKIAEAYASFAENERAESLFKRALEIRIQLLGANHLEVAESYSKLAAFYSALGKFDDAVQAYRQAIAVREKALGPDDPSLTGDVIDLANLYGDHGNDAEAETLEKRGLALQTKQYGPDSVHIARRYHNLGLHSFHLKRYADAESYYKTALAIEEKTLSPGDVEMGRTLTNLTATYTAEGKYGLAETTCHRALGTWEQALGPDNPTVSMAEECMGNVYSHLGQYAKAVPYYEKALATYEKTEGPDDPDVADVLGGLGTAEFILAHFDHAEELLKRALEIQERTLGTDDPQVAATLERLAEAYQGKKQFEAAMTTVQRAIGILEKSSKADPEALAKAREILGGIRMQAAMENTGRSGTLPSAPGTKESREDLILRARVLRNTGHAKEAEEIYKQVVSGEQTTPGVDPALLAADMMELGVLYINFLQRPGEGQQLLELALVIREKAFGEADKDLPGLLEQLGLTAQNQKNYQQAETYYQRAVQLSEKLAGGETAEVANGMSELANAYYEDKKCDLAAPLYKRVTDIYTERLGAAYIGNYYALERLGDCYRRMEKNSDAAAIYERVVPWAEKQFGPQSLNLAELLYSYADVRKELGEGEAAAALERRARGISPQGPPSALAAKMAQPHPQDAILEQARALGRLQKIADEETLLKQAIAAAEKPPAPHQAALAEYLAELCSLYSTHLRYAESGPLCDRAATMHEKALGEDDLLFPGILEEVAFAALQLQDREKVVKFYERALVLRGKLSGDDSLDLALALERTASAYQTAAMFDRAIPLAQHAVYIFEAKTDSKNLMRMGGYEQLVGLFLAQGLDAAAAATYEKLVRAKEGYYGPDNPAVADTLEAYAKLLRKLDRQEQATVVEGRAAAIRSKTPATGKPK